VARLDRETLQQLKEPARARLMQVITLPRDKKVLSRPLVEADFDKRGVVRLGPLAAGTYVLEVIAPGLGVTTIPSIEIEEGKDHTLPHPIRVDRPRAIRVSVNPPHDPHGTPWRVTVWHTAEVTDDSSVVVEKAEISDAGKWAIEGQKAGRYTLILQDSDKSQDARRNFEIQAGADAIVTLDIVTFRAKGRVTIGHRPVAAELNFGDGIGNEFVFAKANETGEFEVLLTRDGVWPLVVHDEAEGKTEAPRDGHARRADRDPGARHGDRRTGGRNGWQPSRQRVAQRPDAGWPGAAPRRG
jgi:hypothetical protein